MIKAEKYIQTSNTGIFVMRCMKSRNFRSRYFTLLRKDIV